jgi:hypothetical protein
MKMPTRPYNLPRGGRLPDIDPNPLIENKKNIAFTGQGLRGGRSLAGCSRSGRRVGLRSADLIGIQDV